MTRSLLAAAVVLSAVGLARAEPPAPPDPALEVVPPGEAAQIEAVVKQTLAGMRAMYANSNPPLRGVHPKDHGCVTATVKVLDDLPAAYRVGVFAQPGKEYQAYVRWSNAAVVAGPDTPKSKQDPTKHDHDSRGLAIKLLGVGGDRLLPGDGPLTQDFLLINQPVFASANVEDYAALRADPVKFLTVQSQQPDAAGARARVTAGIIRRILSLAVDGDKGAFQPPPASPEANDYFSGAPYRFGPGKAVKYKVCRAADAPATPPADLTAPSYLRAALAKRLAPGAAPVVLDFQVLVRTAEQLKGKLEVEIEDACTLWPETADQKYVTVARITIPPQDFNAPAAVARCEYLFFNPWHAVQEYQPLGGINRMKRAVYEASSAFRHLAKEPAGF